MVILHKIKKVPLAKWVNFWNKLNPVTTMPLPVILTGV